MKSSLITMESNYLSKSNENTSNNLDKIYNPNDTIN